MDYCTFVDEDGVRYPFDRVVSYRDLADGFLEVGLLNGSSTTVANVARDCWLGASKNAIRFITPAASGTYFVSMERVVDEPIIAWAQTYAAYGLVPVDAHGPITEFAPGEGILHPDGKVAVPRMRTFESRQQWQKWLRSQFVTPAQENMRMSATKAAS